MFCLNKEKSSKRWQIIILRFILTALIKSLKIFVTTYFAVNILCWEFCCKFHESYCISIEAQCSILNFNIFGLLCSVRAIGDKNVLLLKPVPPDAGDRLYGTLAAMLAYFSFNIAVESVPWPLDCVCPFWQSPVLRMRGNYD